MSGQILEIRDLTIVKDGKPLFLPFSGRIAPGEVLTVMGPSGSGKSSLLNAIAGFLPQTLTATGMISLDGKDILPVPARRRRVGLMFQDALLFPHMSVGDNLAFALPEQTARNRMERDAVIKDALAEAGLPDFADRDPETLSGGQKARVALMRVLLSDPACLLLDEPFSRLDEALRQSIRQFVFDHARQSGLPVFLVSHDQADAVAAGGEVITLQPA